MKQAKKILCPHDFSGHADEALHYALQLAALNEAEVHLLHVLPQLNYYDWNLTGMYPVITKDALEAEKAHSTKRIGTLLDKYKREYPGLKISYELSTMNDVSEAILATAEKKRSQLIVMGSHGRKGISRLLMGSVAESVMRHASCEVMILKRKRKR